MHRTEQREFETCADCGAEVHAARDRGYALDAERVLCFACATRRGGTYDEWRDLWIEPPDVGGLEEEKRP
jgi:hypothetical protein